MELCVNTGYGVCKPMDIVIADRLRALHVMPNVYRIPNRNGGVSGGISSIMEYHKNGT